MASSSRIRSSPSPTSADPGGPSRETTTDTDASHPRRRWWSLPSPIRTLTVGPGLTPGRRTTGGRAFAGFPGSDPVLLLGRRSWSPPVGTSTQPRGLADAILRVGAVFVRCVGADESRLRLRAASVGLAPQISQRVQFLWRGRLHGCTSWCPACREAGRPPSPRHSQRRSDCPSWRGTRSRNRSGTPSVPATWRGPAGWAAHPPRRSGAWPRRCARGGARQLLPPRVRASPGGAARADRRGALLVSARAGPRAVPVPPAAPVPLRLVLRRGHVRPVESHRLGTTALGGPLLELDTTLPVVVTDIATWVRTAT